MNDDPSPAEEFLGNLDMFDNAGAHRFPSFVRIYRSLYPLSKHKWLYDEASLRHCLARAGFRDIQRMNYLESRIPDIASVEREARFANSLCLEAGR